MSSEPIPGPNTPHIERLLRLLERSHDDGRVRDALGRMKPLARDAVTGEVQPTYVYRLICGHLVAVFTQPLPSDTVEIYCGEDACRCYVDIAEHLVGIVDDPSERNRPCDVCGEPTVFVANGRHGCADHLEATMGDTVRRHG